MAGSRKPGPLGYSGEAEDLNDGTMLGFGAKDVLAKLADTDLAQTSAPNNGSNNHTGTAPRKPRFGSPKTPAATQHSLGAVS